MLQSNLVAMHSVHDRLKVEVYALYQSGAKPLHIAKKFRIPITTIKDWIRDEGWDYEKVQKQMEETADRLAVLNLTTADDMSMKMYAAVKQLMERSIEAISDKTLELNNLDIYMKALKILDAANELESRLRKQLRLDATE